ncbi:Uncharacterised protein [Mycobacterium tuberculosis]|uniref:Uncharacterized protein n=1 Tax=Mycobacterium tuberculosis TaxID=1773 RepID=A0A0U0UCM1_MYCTX|nr:Uncharacterised protein [Mycobacterium tuberculosis]COV22590.1 Uncharacterised protein [Mycobacterium tuberculosis]COX35340.1 Uncharacterised protein [Mycobacterium tuberculosis]COZ10946.1 Uncharacterised protein [Mycobacterium tuberculosis]
MAGTVMVRTTNVSIRIPTPMMKPPWTTVPMLENSRPDIEAANIRPAAVITPPVQRTVRITLERTPNADSSRNRDASSML